MQLEKAKVKIRCDMGLCKNMADFTIKQSGTPRSHQMYICTDCAVALGKAIKTALNSSKTKTKKSNLEE